MLTSAECVSCIVDDLAGAMEILSVNEKMKEKIFQESFEFLAKNLSWQRTPSYFITGVHRILKKQGNIKVPFRERRKRCNEVGLRIADRIRGRLGKFENFSEFSFLVKWVVAGNDLDFRTAGLGYDFNVDEIENMLVQKVNEGLAVDQIDDIFRSVKEAKKILYIHDNVGEIALDKLLIGELRKYTHTVISVLRGGPVTSDATMEDGRTVGLPETASDVILAGPDTLGISLEEMSEQLRANLQTSDLIIAKGQANYYALSEYKSDTRAKIACLFRTKCEPISRIFGQKGKVNLAVILDSSS